MVRNVSKVTLKAPVEKVWTALTHPEQVKAWQYGSELITTWKVGSPIRFRTEWNGTVFEQWGQVLEFVHPSLIRYSLFAPAPGREDRPENYFTMVYQLNAAGDKTLLTIVQEDGREGAVQEDPQGEENPVLGALKKLVEESN